MPFSITISTDGAVMFGGNKSDRTEKGKSIIAFPDDFTVIDLETTGLSPEWDEIIEVAAIRVRNKKIVENFSSLVKPSFEIDEFITDLTGITNEMLTDAPAPEIVLPLLRDFIGTDPVVGHNVSFDVNFLYDGFNSILGIPFQNDFIDTRRISRKALPDLEHHRLIDIAKALEIVPKAQHRSLADSETALSCFLSLRERIEKDPGIDEFVNSFRKKHYNTLDLRTIKAETSDFDETHPLFGKHCVFTGTLSTMTRSEAAQAVVNLGGSCENGITKNTNFLIVGSLEYSSNIKNGKSNKQKKAEAYKLKGLDIETIPETVFLDLISE